MGAFTRPISQFHRFLWERVLVGDGLGAALAVPSLPGDTRATSAPAQPTFCRLGNVKVKGNRLSAPSLFMGPTVELCLVFHESGRAFQKASSLELFVQLQGRPCR